jgi:hypothetical protein
MLLNAGFPFVADSPETDFGLPAHILEIGDCEDLVLSLLGMAQYVQTEYYAVDQCPWDPIAIACVFHEADGRGGFRRAGCHVAAGLKSRATGALYPMDLAVARYPGRVSTEELPERLGPMFSQYLNLLAEQSRAFSSVGRSSESDLKFISTTGMVQVGEHLGYWRFDDDDPTTVGLNRWMDMLVDQPMQPYSMDSKAVIAKGLEAWRRLIPKNFQTVELKPAPKATWPNVEPWDLVFLVTNKISNDVKAVVEPFFKFVTLSPLANRNSVALAVSRRIPLKPSATSAGSNTVSMDQVLHTCAFPPRPTRSTTSTGSASKPSFLKRAEIAVDDTAEDVESAARKAAKEAEHAAADVAKDTIDAVKDVDRDVRKETTKLKRENRESKEGDKLQAGITGMLSPSSNTESAAPTKAKAKKKKKKKHKNRDTLRLPIGSHDWDAIGSTAAGSRMTSAVGHEFDLAMAGIEVDGVYTTSHMRKSGLKHRHPGLRASSSAETSAGSSVRQDDVFQSQRRVLAGLSWGPPRLAGLSQDSARPTYKSSQARKLAASGHRASASRKTGKNHRGHARVFPVSVPHMTNSDLRQHARVLDS